MVGYLTYPETKVETNTYDWRAVMVISKAFFERAGELCSTGEVSD